MPRESNDRDVGITPVRADLPAGTNPRDGDAFAALQAQIERLTDIHARAAIDWNAVRELASKILSQEGKDLSVGVWLCTALFHTRALEGLADGIHVLRDLATTYWEQMSPAAKRLRGRRNQMQWLLEHLGDALEKADTAFTPLPADTHAALQDDWETLDTTWQQYDDEAPAFYGLRATLKSLPVVAPIEPDQTPAVDTVSSSLDASAAVSAIAPAPAVSASGSSVPSVSAVAVPSSGADPEALAEAGLSGLRPLIEWYLNEHPTLPLLFRLNRICAWATLDQAPPAQNGLTRLPPPPDQVVVGFEQITKNGEPAAMIHFAESRLIGLRYWLDINHASHAALSQLGASDAAKSVAFETSRLLARMPLLAEMKFSDGRPFANAATQTWLQALSEADAGHSIGGGQADALSEITQAAQSEAADGKLDAALDRLQTAARQAGSRRDHFRLRLAQCALLQRFDVHADMRPLLATLIQELDVHRLSTWEPDLARQTLQLAAAVELRYGAPGAGANDSMLARLAGLDLRAAWQLSQSTTAA